MKTQIEKLAKEIHNDLYNSGISLREYEPLSVKLHELRNLITKEKEQREELIKEVAISVGTEMHEKGFHDCIESMNERISFCHKEEAERYYNEVIKPKLNK